jgi:predicted ATPase with chaperone activity
LHDGVLFLDEITEFRRAALLIEQAEATLEEASGVIANGYLRLDREERVRTVEKWRAALGG